ncbi:MAG TPA: carboxypeptidase-like regulatory domain-containing protein [Flavobacteriales bacterium]|nr:carboxypeptidase-like regulatory domain-containing protein [Flavobacteriales bacterium]HMR27085.1 carboxypeptidase-like regulatory domain-containing protein [Flavobacteriales bacterium]
MPHASKPLLFLCGVLLTSMAFAQRAFTITGRVKVEGGGLENTKVVVYKNGEKDRVLTSGLGKFNLDLTLNANYVLSFEKDGFVTKKLVFDTKVPADAAANGFSPFEFAVSLFKQYDDINIVVFNQPVGMIRYEASVDDFDYDTDYTKSIQSQLQTVMEQVEQKQAEEQQQAKEQEKQAAEAAKAKAQAEVEAKKAADAAKKEEAKRKAAEEAEAERLAAAERKAEEERKAAEARKAEEDRKAAAAAAKSAPPPQPAAAVVSREEPPPPPPMPRVTRNRLAARVVEGEDGRRTQDPVAGDEPSPVRPAQAQQGSEDRPEEPVILAEVVREEELIVEPNKVMTVIRLEREGVSTEFKRIVHKWGGVFYFKNGDSCTREVYESEALATAE